MSIKLTPEQELAASYHEGRRTVVATAGAGKTTALSMRIARLINLKGVEKEILATSFTNASAKELRERINLYLGRKSDIITGTFHSYCISLISTYYERVGFDVEPRILNEYQWKKVLERLLLTALDARDTKDLPYELDYLYSWMGEFDARHHSTNPFDRDPRLEGTSPPVVFRQVWEEYRAKARRECFLSYDDILTVALEILRSEIDTPKYIFIDEAQDLSGIQWCLAEELSKRAISTDVIGDDDQSIYTWRGARPKRFSEFAENSEKVFLTSNRRCGRQIVYTAKEVIEKIPSTRRIAKDLSSSREENGNVRFSVLRDFISYPRLAAKIRYQVEHEGRKWSDFALISRSAGQVGGTFDRLQAALATENVPYRLLGGDKMSYERTECDFLKTLLSLSQKTPKETAILWENLLCGAGTDSRAAANIMNEASKSGLSMESIRYAIKESRISSSSKSQYDGLINAIYGFREKRSFADILGNPLVRNLTADIVSDEVRKRKKFEGDELKEASAERLRSVDMLFDPFKNLSIKEATKKLLLDFETEREAGDVVTISTAHSAKGLEWNSVFVIDANHRAWPNGRSIQSAKGLSTTAFDAAMDEEIRLFYVAITRAKNELTFISPVDKAHLNTRNEPTPFLPDWMRVKADAVFEEVEKTKKTNGIDIFEK